MTETHRRRVVGKICTLALRVGESLGGVRPRVALSLDGAAPPVEEVAADSPGASVAADLAAGEHGGPRQAAFAMA